MRYKTVIAAAAFAAFAVAPMPEGLSAQGQGKGQARGQSGERPAAAQEKGRGQERAQAQQPRGQGQARGAAQGKGRQDAPAASRAAGPPAHARARFARDVRVADMPPAVRRFATSNRAPQRVAAGAVARGQARGLRDDLRIVPAGDRIQVLNRRGDVLLRLDEDRARNLGRWQVDVLDRPPHAGSPSFCRSGAGHPVWGRQWCLEKDFGLGTFEDFRWGRTTRVEDIILRRPRTGELLATAALQSVLGNTAFDRLALHAVTLGFTDPLTGRWGNDPDGGRILLVDSGRRPVAEIVDRNRNDRADALLVALRPW